MGKTGKEPENQRKLKETSLGRRKEDQRIAVAETWLLSESKLQRKRKEHGREERRPQTVSRPHKPGSSTGRHMPTRQLRTAGWQLWEFSEADHLGTGAIWKVLLLRSHMSDCGPESRVLSQMFHSSNSKRLHPAR